MKLGRSKPASALIMVMLVIAGITTIVFATQRIALVQFSQSVREEDNLTAYYAAKAGIEDGLARYRFERNTETTIDKKFRFNITKATYPGVSDNYEIPRDTEIEEGVSVGGSGDYNPNYQYYDLVISYRTQRINIDEDGDIIQALMDRSTIKKDEILTLTGFPSTNSGINYLRYVYNFDPVCDDIDKAFATMQIVIESEIGGLVGRKSEQIKVEKPAGSNNQYDSAVEATNLDLSNSGTSSAVSSIRIRAYHCDVNYAFATSSDPDGNGGDGNKGLEFDSLTTEILSTGYFGSTKRTLIAQVDRQTGNLLGIFDFILYSGGNTGISR